MGDFPDAREKKKPGQQTSKPPQFAPKAFRQPGQGIQPISEVGATKKPGGGPGGGEGDGRGYASVNFSWHGQRKPSFEQRHSLVAAQIISLMRRMRQWGITPMNKPTNGKPPQFAKGVPLARPVHAVSYRLRFRAGGHGGGSISRQLAKTSKVWPSFSTSQHP